MYETLTIILAGAGLLINGAGLIFVGGQVVVANRQLRLTQSTNEAEDARRKRQATIDFYMSTIERVIEWRDKLPNDWESEAIERFTNEAYASNDQERLKLIAAYLGFFEALAVAVRKGVYDLAVLDGIAGSRLMNIGTNYQSFFVRRRQEVGAQSAYKNLEWLSREIALLPSRQGQPEDRSS